MHGFACIKFQTDPREFKNLHLK